MNIQELKSELYEICIMNGISKSYAKKHIEEISELIDSHWKLERFLLIMDELNGHIPRTILRFRKENIELN